MEGRSSAGVDRFVHRLLQSTDLSEHDQASLLGLTGRSVEQRARTDLVLPGQTVDYATLIVDGLVARFDQMGSGARQLTAVYIPGDLCDLHSVVAPHVGWGLQTLTKVKILRVPHDQIRALVAASPSIGLALWRDTTIDASIMAKRLSYVGRAPALSRIAHFFCETGIRMELAGLADRASYPLGMTQEALGEAMGLTPIHINRTLRALRDRGVVTWRNRQVDVHDWDELETLADFDPAYFLGTDLRPRDGINGDLLVSS